MTIWVPVPLKCGIRVSDSLISCLYVFELVGDYLGTNSSSVEKKWHII